MKRINFMRFSFSVLVFLFVIGATNAQTKIWGVGSATGLADAEFSLPFVNATTAGSYSATQWTALTISSSSGVTLPGASYWIRSTTGLSQGAYAATQTPIASPSMANGSALFDSDYLDNNGTAGAFGTGVSPAYQKGELISPRLDLSGYADSALVVKFYCKRRAFLVDSLKVAMSLDDGLTWSFVDINRWLPAGTNETNEGWVRAPFYSITAGATSLSQCRIKFVFDGRYYYTALDDISVEMAPPSDIAIGTANPDGTLLSDGFHFVRIGNNRYIPENNIDPTDFKEWFWGMKVVNYGSETLLTSQNAKAYVDIEYTSAIGVPGGVVYSDTMDVTDELVPVTTYGNDTIVLVESLRELGFLQTTGAGEYVVKYWVSSDASNASTDNDTLFYTFTLSPGGSDYISKSPLELDGKVAATNAILPGGGPEFQSIEYGTMFHFPKGGTHAVTIDSVDFAYYVRSTYTGAQAQTLAVNIYEFVDGSGLGTATATGTLDDDGLELSYLGIGIANIPQIVAVGTYGKVSVSNFIEPATGGAMAPLDDDGIYFITVWENPGTLISGGSPTFNNNTGVYIGATSLNYAINATMTDGAEVVPNPSPVKVLDNVGGGDWNWVGFGADVQPSIGVHVTITLPLDLPVVSTFDVVDLKLYPSPADEMLNMEVSFDEATDVRYIMTDVSGHVLNITYSKNVTNDVQTLDVSRLAAGVYMVSVKTDKGSTTKRFIKK